MMGKSPPLRHPPFYRHQQVIPGHTAAEGEPDGTSATRGGGSTIRHRSIQLASQELQMTVNTA